MFNIIFVDTDRDATTIHRIETTSGICSRTVDRIPEDFKTQVKKLIEIVWMEKPDQVIFDSNSGVLLASMFRYEADKHGTFTIDHNGLVNHLDLYKE